MSVSVRDARRFDLLLLRLQHSLLSDNADFVSLRNHVIAIAEALSAVDNIPMVAAQAELLAEIVQMSWWTGVTVAQLEDVRQRLRLLVQHVPKAERAVVYTNVEDRFGEATIERHDEFAAGVNMRRYKETVERFVLDSEDHPVVQKILAAVPLSAQTLPISKHIFMRRTRQGRARSLKRFMAHRSILERLSARLRASTVRRRRQSLISI